MHQTVRLTELKIPIGESGKAHIEVACVGQLGQHGWECVEVETACLYLDGHGIDLTSSLDYRDRDMRTLVASETEAFVVACEEAVEQQRLREGLR